MTQRSTPLTADLVPSLTELKNNLRISGNDLDTDLTVKLLAAIYNAEHFIGRVIALSVFTLTDKFSPSVDLTKSPLIEVTSVKVDGDTLVSGTDYTVSGNTVTFSDEVCGYVSVGAEIEIKYKAGRTELEPDVKMAILMAASSMFLNPEDHVETLPKASTNLLRPYRNWELGDDE